MDKHEIAIAGAGYVDLSNALLLVQHNKVAALASPDPLFIEEDVFELKKKIGEVLDEQ